MTEDPGYTDYPDKRVWHDSLKRLQNELRIYEDDPLIKPLIVKWIKQEKRKRRNK